MTLRYDVDIFGLFHHVSCILPCLALPSCPARFAGERLEKTMMSGVCFCKGGNESRPVERELQKRDLSGNKQESIARTGQYSLFIRSYANSGHNAVHLFDFPLRA